MEAVEAVEAVEAAEAVKEHQKILMLPGGEGGGRLKTEPHPPQFDKPSTRVRFDKSL